MAIGGLFGILPEVQNILVNEHLWITAQDFIQAFTIGQFTPGPNSSMFGVVGYQIAGFGGWFAALAGIYAGSLVMMGIASHYYEKHRHIPWLKRVELALRPLVIGLMSASAINIFSVQTKAALIPALIMSIVVAWLYAKKNLSALLAILVSGAIWWVIGKF